MQENICKILQKTPMQWSVLLVDFFGHLTSYFLVKKGLSGGKCFRTAFLYKTLWWLTASVFFHVLCKFHNSEIEILFVCFLSIYLTWGLHFKISRLPCLVLQLNIEFLTIFDLTFKGPFISESCIELKMKLNFHFRTSLWCLKRFYEGL